MIRRTGGRRHDSRRAGPSGASENRAEAEVVAAEMEARGHKQTYWVAAAD